MTDTVVKEGPHGLHYILFVDGPFSELHIEREPAMFSGNGYWWRVNNALRMNLANGYFNGDEDTWEQAKQWLFDMVTLRSRT
jgi:hypothetical protein